MTHRLANFAVKVLTDDQKERWYAFFRANVTDPFLMLSEFDLEALAGIVKFEKESALEAAANETREDANGKHSI